MRKTVWLGVACVLGAAAINACSSSSGGTASTEGAGDTGVGGGTTSSATTSTSTTTSTSGTGGAMTTSSSTSSSSSTTSSSSSGSALVNGCDPATAADHTADASVTVTFPTGGLKYSPACIKISAGSSVKFSGDFSSHPLTGGVDGTADPTSPIADTETGTSATFTFPDAGSFGYYCKFHVGSGMKGAVFVQ